MRQALGTEFVPVFLEKDEEAEFVKTYGVLQFPTVVFTDAAGESIETVIHPESSGEVLKGLDFARRWLRGEVDLGE